MLRPDDEHDPSGSPYRAALARMRQELEDGRFRSVEMLPSERDLAETFSVSRTTLRRVLAQLAQEGHLVQRQGIGTFVVRERDRPDAAGPSARRPDPLGVGSSSRELGQMLGLPSASEALILGCRIDEPVLRLRRLHYVEAGVAALETTAVPARLLAGRSRLDGPPAEALAVAGVPVRRTLERIGATTLDQAEAANLEMARGSAALEIGLAFYGEDGQCCACSRTLARPDRYDLVTERLFNEP